MSIKKKFTMVLGTFLSLAFLLFATLVIHIAIMVKGRKPLENPNIQMARADFKLPVDTSTINGIRTQLMTTPGVKDSYFDHQSNILVYTFDAKQNNARNIYNKAIKSPQLGSEIHVFTQEEESKGCPAIDNKSFYGKLTIMVERVMNWIG